MISILIIICKFSVHFFGRRNIRGHQTGETVPERRKKPYADTRMGKSVSEWVNIVNLLQDYATLFPTSQNVDRRDCFCRYFDTSVPLLGTEATPGLARNEGSRPPAVKEMPDQVGHDGG